MAANVEGFTAGRLGNHLAVLFLVLLWTIPTFGLFVSAFRTATQIETSGWWQALTSQQIQDTIRLPLSADAVTEENGQFVLRGTIVDEDSVNRVVSFGTQPRSFDGFQPGETGEFRNGDTITLEEDGTFAYASADEIDRAPRVRVTLQQPPQFSLSNFQFVLGGENMGQAFVNSATVTIPATVIPITIAAFAAYALSWMTFPARGFLLAVVVGLLVVPLQMSLIPLLQVYTWSGTNLGWDPKSGYWGIWLAHTAFGLPLAIYLLRNYMVGLPREIMESARMDGATHFQIFTRLALPLSLPALASFAIFQFLWVWNDLLIALVFLGRGEDQVVLQSAIIEQLGTYGGEWGILSASAFITIIVPLVVFLSLQRYFVRGLLAGSVK